MRSVLAAAALAALWLAQGAWADELDIPPKYAEAVERANAIGTQIFVHDAACSRATDELFARKALPDDSRVRGWLTERYDAGENPGILVTFIGDAQGKPLALYRVRVPAGERPLEYQALTPPAALDDGQVAAWKARTAATRALESHKDLCGERYNTVVLPAGTPGIDGIRVYMLAATTQPDLMIAGGHFLYEYTADGVTLKSERAFTRACVDLPLKEDPAKGELKGLMLTHLLDPTPTEIHVFLSRSSGKNIYLATPDNKMMWFIMNGAIVAAKDLSKK